MNNEADLEVFPDGQIGEDVPALRDVTNPGARALVGLEGCKVLRTETNGALVRPDKPDDGFQSSGLANAVAAHEADQTMLRHCEVYSPQDAGAVIRGRDFRES